MPCLASPGSSCIVSNQSLTVSCEDIIPLKQYTTLAGHQAVSSHPLSATGWHRAAAAPFCAGRGCMSQLLAWYLRSSAVCLPAVILTLLLHASPCVRCCADVDCTLVWLASMTRRQTPRQNAPGDAVITPLAGPVLPASTCKTANSSMDLFHPCYQHIGWDLPGATSDSSSVHGKAALASSGDLGATHETRAHTSTHGNCSIYHAACPSLLPMSRDALQPPLVYARSGPGSFLLSFPFIYPIGPGGGDRWLCLNLRDQLICGELPAETRKRCNGGVMAPLRVRDTCVCTLPQSIAILVPTAPGGHMMLRCVISWWGTCGIISAAHSPVNMVTRYPKSHALRTAASTH